MAVLERFSKSLSLTLSEKTLAANILIFLLNQGGKWPYKDSCSHSDRFILSFLESRGYVERNGSDNYKLSEKGFKIAKGLKETAEKNGQHYLSEWQIAGEEEPFVYRAFLYR
jgi:repressor of nif and glnA expression